MKITYLKLRNFIGIYNGLGKKEIELDLTKGSNSITLLVGSNGSGKSTIMSTLHPFHGTFDDRSSIILPGHDGYKEVHIQTEKGLYTIQHHYNNKKKTKSVKSFIQLNGVELNENGGVKTFEEVIKEELDLVPSFMTLSKIGSNVAGFIDKKSTDRKQIINEFLPDIEDYLYYYKIINDKWSNCRKQIKSVTDSLAKLDDIEHLNAQENATVDSINNYDQLIESESKSCTEYEYELNKLDPDGSIREQFKELATEYKSLEKELDILNAIDFGKYQSLDDVLSANDKLILKRTAISDRLDNNTKRVEELNKQLVQDTELLNEKETLLDKYTMDKDLNEYKEIKLEYELELNRINEEANNYNNTYTIYNQLDLDTLNDYDNQFSKVEEAINGLLERTDHTTIRNANLDFASNYNESLSELRRAKDELRDKLNDAKSKRTEMLANLHHAETLEQRPKSCTDDNCPFIKLALKYANLDQQLAKQEELVNKYESEYEKVNIELDTLCNTFNIFKDIMSIYNMIRYNPLLKLIIFNNTELEVSVFIEDIILNNRDKYRNITNIKDYVGLKDDIKKYEKLLEEVCTNILILEDKQVLIDSLNNDIDRLSKSIDTANQTLIELKDTNESDKQKLQMLDDLENRLADAKEHFELVNKKQARYNEVKQSIKDIEETIRTIKEINVKLKESRNTLEEYKRNKEPYIKQLDKIKINKAKIEEYTITKAELDAKFNKLNIVRNALNPTKGIPLLFINTYLTKTKLIANKLLDVAFNGKFQIEEFEVTDKDFFIKLRKEDGELVPDILNASQGERALVSVAISMALIQQSMRKYNILLLDEIDSELDANNRRAFINILETQFEMLGIEQCFLITHNNEFDTYNTDLILMKNHNIDTTDSEFMSNKTIIFEA